MKKIVRTRATLTTLPIIGGMAFVNPEVLASFETFVLAFISVLLDLLAGE